MIETWRWFGPADVVSITDIAQAGASGVVTALHHIPNGSVWSSEEIALRHREITVQEDGAPTGITWQVVESLPVSEEIKKRDGDWQKHIDNYKKSLENLATSGLRVICYNFMPVLDWTRTDLAWSLPNQSTCMRFDWIDFVVFDLFILERLNADQDYDIATNAAAKERVAQMSDAEKSELMENITQGLPGANQQLTFDDFRGLLDSYKEIDAAKLRENLHLFLAEIIPVAERLGLRMCCHPDDPPFALLGLPRVVSTEADYTALVEAVDSPANGITLCSGSLGVDPNNDLTGMMQRLGHRVHFLHLRNVKREDDHYPGSFHEAAHLEGSTDMISLIDAILAEEDRRKTEGREDCSLPMRPDHGHQIADDFNRRVQPGYPLIGRLRGLAEIRGVAAALATKYKTSEPQE